MRVLYLHPAGTFGGASKSLLELYTAAKKLEDIDATILTPHGTAAKAFKSAGMNVFETIGLAQFDHTRFGYYRNLRWLILLRELFYLPFTLAVLLKIRRTCQSFNLIHVNEITLLPSAYLAKWVFKLPMIFHIRSVQHPNQQGMRTKFVFNRLTKLANKVICIDETVRSSLPQWIDSVVIHNSISIESSNIVKSQPRDKLAIGMAGVLLRSKGVYEFLEAAKILVKEKNRDVHFIVAGENARDTGGMRQWLLKKLGFYEDVLSESKRYVRENTLEQNIIFSGFLTDIRVFYPEIDVLCFPSHLNACGRPVFEAALFGIPSIVAIRDPLEDAIIDGVTGLAIDRPAVTLLANAIDTLIVNHDLRKKLGEQAKVWANAHFNIDKSVKTLVEVYFSNLK